MNTKEFHNTKKHKNAIILLALLMLISAVSGCGRTSSTAGTPIQDLSDQYSEPVIDVETSSKGIDSSRKDFLEQLVSGTFYIVHEGIYYPIFTDTRNEAAESYMNDAVNEMRLNFYTKSDDDDIPTMFPGDHLVYYSTSDLLDVITWERYKDMGYIIGLKNLIRTEAGRYFINISKDGESPLFEDNSLINIQNLPVEKVLIDKLGDIPIDDEVIERGMIVGTTKNQTYALEVYTGTNYKYYDATADVHAFGAYENFASTKFETLQTNFWEVPVPQYFVAGYYNVNNTGLFRLVRESSYSEKTDFNVQMLYPSENDASIRTYSDEPNINKFRSETPGTLGYVDPEEELARAEGESEEESETDSEIDDKIAQISKFKEANIKQYELWFPAGKQCSIKITSPSGETGGNATITFDTGATDSLQYNRFDKVYETVINGKGNKGLLVVSGFWKNYTIDLVNAEIYKDQDKSADEPMDSNAAPSEPTPKENNTEQPSDTTTDTQDQQSLPESQEKTVDIFGGGR